MINSKIINLKGRGQLSAVLNQIGSDIAMDWKFDFPSNGSKIKRIHYGFMLQASYTDTTKNFTACELDNMAHYLEIALPGGVTPGIITHAFNVESTDGSTGVFNLDWEGIRLERGVHDFESFTLAGLCTFKAFVSIPPEIKAADLQYIFFYPSIVIEYE